MISFKINNVPTLFIRGYTPDDTDTILNFVHQSCEPHREDDSRVLFIDTPATKPTVEAVKELKARGYRVIFRDHHGLDHEPNTEAERKKHSACLEIKRALGNDCVITTRELHPACSTLVEIGEFKNAGAIIADPDADGLTAATKAAGLFYPELDLDAAKLDGEPALHMTGSPLSCLLAKGIATLPKIDPRNPESRDKFKQQLFAYWVLAVQGNQEAQEKLNSFAVAYEEGLKVAEALSKTATEVAPGVVLVDVLNTVSFDEGALTVFLEKTPGCRITVVRKAIGPIAALHGVQYSLAISKEYQRRIDLQRFLPEGTETGPQAGAISNVSFLLHVSEDIWKRHVLPACKSLPETL
jgi:hypothetical protein